jgi:hypothetical protein
MVESLIRVGKLRNPLLFSVSERDILLFKHPGLLWGPGCLLFEEY